jgi:hypothetical protein
MQTCGAKDLIAVWGKPIVTLFFDYSVFDTRSGTDKVWTADRKNKQVAPVPITPHYVNFWASSVISWISAVAVISGSALQHSEFRNF